VPATFGTSLLFTIIIVSISLAGLVICRRWLLAAELKTQHDVADPLSQVVGMMFAVLLGFMVGDAMQRFSTARSTTQQEAASLGDVFILAEGLPAANRDRIRKLCVDYAERVVKIEWPLLARKQTSPEARESYVLLAKECATYNPITQGQSNVQQSLLPAIVSLGDCRRLRVEALNNSLAPTLWLVLLIGGAATILFTYFFGAGNFKIQMLMVAIVSVVICLNIFLLVAYDDPFTGDVMVYPTAFETDLAVFREQICATKNAQKGPEATK
jgi:hypothetical protein